MKADPDNAKDRLQRLADDLKALSPDTSPLNFVDAQWLAEGINKFLSSQVASLDNALGLKLSRGRPSTKKHQLICDVWAASKDGTTAEQLAQTVHLSHKLHFKTEPDPKEIMRAVGTLSKDPKIYLLPPEQGGWSECARLAISALVIKRMHEKSKT